MAAPGRQPLAYIPVPLLLRPLPPYEVDFFFGLVIGFGKELGYFSLWELESARGRFGVAIERDLYFTPGRFSAVLKRALIRGQGAYFPALFLCPAGNDWGVTP